MDHIPDPSDACSPIVTVPVLCSRLQYDDGDWASFPQRQGWQRQGDLLIQKSGSTFLSLDENSAIFQSWLFFGLLTEFSRACGMPFKAEAFQRIEKSNNHLILSTKCLPGYLDEIAKHEGSLSPRIQKTHHRRVLALLQKVCNVTFEVLTRGGLLVNKFPVRPDVSLAILILAETLANSVGHIWPEFPSKTSIPLAPTRWTYDQMLQRGWCKRDVFLLHSTAGATTCYYATRLPRIGLARDHLGCTDAKCIARQINEEDYQTQHAVPDCDHGQNCVSVRVDPEKLISKLRHSAVPRVSIVSAPHLPGGVQLEVVGEGSGPYVAISHVWSDGLGNPHENALPSCQLRGLASLVADLYRSNNDQGDGGDADEKCQTDLVPIPIWLDTLCVPTKAEPRKLALMHLVRAYEEADKVLVLDKDLTGLECQTSAEEILVRIQLCGWMQRLWTLEEAILGFERLFIQFQGGARSFQELLTSARTFPHQSIAFDAATAIQAQFPPRRGVDIPELHELGVAMLYRSTSRKEDEGLCLASLMGLDVAEISSYHSADQRMKMVYLAVGKISSDILFIAGPKIREPGFRWAPQTLMRRDKTLQRALQRWDPSLSPELAARVSEDGLLHSCLATCLEFGKNSINVGLGRFFILKFDNLWFRVSPVVPDGILVSQFEPDNDDESNTSAWDKLAFAPEEARDHTHLLAMIHTTSRPFGHHAALVKIDNVREDKTIVATYLCPLHVEAGFQIQPYPSSSNQRSAATPQPKTWILRKKDDSAPSDPPSPRSSSWQQVANWFRWRSHQPDEADVKEPGFVIYSSGSTKDGDDDGNSDQRGSMPVSTWLGTQKWCIT